MFGKMRSDPTLSFRSLCGQEPQATSKKKKAALVRAVALAARSSAEDMEDDGSDGSVSGEDSDGVDVVATPTGKRETRGRKTETSTATTKSPMKLGKQIL